MKIKTGYVYSDLQREKVRFYGNEQDKKNLICMAHEVIIVCFPFLIMCFQ
jgi:hypothetical protein